MYLRVPSGGGGWFDALVGDTIQYGPEGSEGPATPETLRAALDAIANGWIEYVILGDGAVFVQAAGQGAGPYLLQYSPGSASAMLRVPSGVDQATLRGVFERVLAGDPGWHAGLSWQPMG